MTVHKAGHAIGVLLVYSGVAILAAVPVGVFARALWLAFVWGWGLV